MATYDPLPLATQTTIGTRPVSLTAPPTRYVVREHLGLLTHEALDGQVVHRAPQTLYETRATITPKGDYLLMFPEGGHYNGSVDKVNDMLAYRSKDRGKTWQGPTKPFDIEYSQHGFCPLIPKGSKRIYAFGTQPLSWLHSMEHGQGENCPIGYRYSDDDGYTWGEVRLIRPQNDPNFTGMFVMRLCETDPGTWLLAPHEGDWSYHPVTSRLYVMRSADQGKTWTVLPRGRHGGWSCPTIPRMDEGRCINLGGGEVYLMTRTPEGHLWHLRNTHDGQTWSEPAPTPLIHPDAPPMLFHLSDGKTLIAFHHNRHSAKVYRGLGVDMNDVMQDRSEIWFSTSSDKGHTWSEPRFLFANAAAANRGNPFLDCGCSYLDAIIDDGMINIFCPHRWQQALHLTIKESALSQCRTRAEMGL